MFAIFWYTEVSIIYLNLNFTRQPLIWQLYLCAKHKNSSWPQGTPSWKISLKTVLQCSYQDCLRIDGIKVCIYMNIFLFYSWNNLIRQVQVPVVVLEDPTWFQIHCTFICVSVFFLLSLSQVRIPGQEVHMSWALPASLVDIFCILLSVDAFWLDRYFSNHLLVLCITAVLMCS